MTNDIKRIISESIEVKSKILASNELVYAIENVVALIVQCFTNGNKVWFCGNGGSAADAQHLAAEFSGRFYMDRKPLPAEALHCNSSYLTAVANDYGYEFVFSRMLQGSAQKGDIVFGLSTSGNSPNICNAFTMAKSMGVITVAITGASGGKMKSFSDYLLNVPSNDTPRIQEAHIMIGHVLCELAEKNLFEKGNDQ